MTTTTTVRIPGLGLVPLTFVTLLILKGTETVDWSWWWITSPLWLPPAILACVASLTLLGALVMDYLGNRKRRARIAKQRKAREARADATRRT